jgi:hypothetical protein
MSQDYQYRYLWQKIAFVVFSFLLIYYQQGNRFVHAQISNTQILSKTGEARISEPIPFFSGWTLTQKAMSLKSILMQKHAGYLLVFCASWSPDSEALLKQIYLEKKQLEQADISLILMLEDASPKQQLQAWLKGLNINFATVLIDHHQALAEKFDLKHPNGISTNEGLKKRQREDINQQQAHLVRKKAELIEFDRVNPKDLFLNKAIAFDRDAQVKAIFGIDGQDFIEQVIKAFK